MSNYLRLQFPMIRNSFRFKDCKYIEWIVSVIDFKTYDSDFFAIQNKKCYLRLDPAGKQLYFQSEGQLQSPITVTVSVQSTKVSSSSRTTITGESKSIWIWTHGSTLLGERLTVEVIIHMDFPKEDICTQTASYLNPQLSAESLTEDFSNLLNSGLKNDAELKCGEHSIKVHKIILSARSEVFKKMLESKMREGRTGVIHFRDMDPDHFQEFARYLYTGILPELTLDKAKAFYQSGDKYAIRSLVVRCAEYMEDNLSKENAFEIFALADTHSDQKLKDNIITFILNEKLYEEETYWMPFYENFPTVALEVYRSSYKKRRVV